MHIWAVDTSKNMTTFFRKQEHNLMNKLPNLSIMTIDECHIMEQSERSNMTRYTQNTKLATCQVEIHEGAIFIVQIWLTVYSRRIGE